MIIGINGRQRTGKNVLAVRFALTLCPELGITAGYGNSSIVGLPFQYSKLSSRETIDRLFEAFNTGEENLFFFIDEAHRILNPRAWSQWSKEDTFSLAGIFQDDKLNNLIIYTYSCGYDEKDELLGVDKMVRASTGRLVEIDSDRTFVEIVDAIIYYESRFDEKKRNKPVKPIKNIIYPASQYFLHFDTKEAVI